jgi:hypothetical protein
VWIWWDHSIYNKDTSQNTFSSLSICTHNGWCEIVQATNKSAIYIQDLFDNTWLARYPQPQFIVFDNGDVGEFKREFKQMCDNYGIKSKPTTSHNPQANAMISKDTKFSMGNSIIRSFDLENNHENLE